MLMCLGFEVPDAGVQSLILGVERGEPLQGRGLGEGGDYRAEVRWQQQRALIHAAGIP